MSVKGFLHTGNVSAFLGQDIPELLEIPPPLQALTPLPEELPPPNSTTDYYAKLVADYYTADGTKLIEKIHASKSFAKTLVMTRLYNEKFPDQKHLTFPIIKGQKNLPIERDILKNIIPKLHKGPVKDYATGKLLDIRRELSYETQVKLDRLADLLQKKTSIYPKEAKTFQTELKNGDYESIETRKYTWDGDNSLKIELENFNESIKRRVLLDDTLLDDERADIVANFKKNLILLNIVQPPLNTAEENKISDIESRLHGMDPSDPNYAKLIAQRESIAGLLHLPYEQFHDNELTAFHTDPLALLQKAKEDLALIELEIRKEGKTANEKKRLQRKYQLLAVAYNLPTLKQISDAKAALKQQAKLKRLLDAQELKLANGKIDHKKEINNYIEDQVRFLDMEIDTINETNDNATLKLACNTILGRFDEAIPLTPCQGIALQKNQASVYLITKLRAQDKRTTPGVLVKHGTGSGKTICGLITMLNFWNTTWEDSNGKLHLWAIFFVSTAKNQDEDNDIFKQASTMIKFFSFFTTPYYNGTHHPIENAIFSTEFYQANKNDLTHIEFVAKLINSRMNMGYKESYLKSDDEIASMPAAKQEHILDERKKFFNRRSEKPLTTYGKLGYDFATVFWPDDRNHFENSSLRAKEKMEKEVQSELTHAVHDYFEKIVTLPLQKILKSNTKKETVTLKVNAMTLLLFNNSHLPFKTDEIKNDYDEMIANPRKWNSTIQNLIWQKMSDNRDGRKSFYIKSVDEALTIFLAILQTFGIGLEKDLKYGQNVYSFTYTEQIIKNDVEIVNDDEDEDDEEPHTKAKPANKSIFREETLYLKTNEHRQVQHCVFILDEVQQMFDIAAKEAGKRVDYDRCQYALKYYRDPMTTYVVALTATPGSTDTDVAQIMSMVASSSDVFVNNGDKKLSKIANPVFEDIARTVKNSDDDEIFRRTIIKEPGHAFYPFDPSHPTKHNFYEIPTPDNPFYRFRIKDAFSPLNIEAEIEDIHQPLVTYVDFSGDSQRYADLTVVPKLVKHSKAYTTLFDNHAKQYRTQLEQFQKTMNASSWLNSSKLNQRTIASKYMAFYSYYGIIDNGQSLKPMLSDYALKKDEKLLTFPKRKRLAFFRALNLYCKTDRLGVTSKYNLDIVDGKNERRFVPSEKFMTILADVLSATGFPDLAKQKGDNLKKKTADEALDTQDSMDDETTNPDPIPSTIHSLDDLLEPEPRKNPQFRPGKHYIYCSNPFALYAFAYYLHFYSNGFLQPYNNEDLATLLDQKKKGIRYFYYTEAKGTLVKPFNLVCVDSDLKKGKKIAASDLTFDEYRELYPNDPKFTIKTEQPLVNIAGNLIPIILATGESYKGVDMKGITDLYAMDSFLDMQDLIQFMGRGPRMCSHSMFANPDRRHVKLHLYFADRDFNVNTKNDEKENTDLWLLKESQLVYNSFLEKIANAFTLAAYDSLTFQEIHKKVDETRQILLTLDPENIILPEKTATKRAIDDETIKDAIKAIMIFLPGKLFVTYFNALNADDDYKAVKAFLLNQIDSASPFGKITSLIKNTSGDKKSCEFTIPTIPDPIIFEVDIIDGENLRNFKERLKSRLKFYMCDAWLSPPTNDIMEKNGDIFANYAVIHEKLANDTDAKRHIYERKPSQ